MGYWAVVEKGERNYSAYFPDLPGCVATGGSLEEVREHLREALVLHLESMREDGEPIPLPRFKPPFFSRLSAGFLESRKSRRNCKEIYFPISA